mmetsp:Transcript_59658/g.141135  ORF Transcript_59658/g.141135 Transcript_59658/m.141135 type:complete len:405 (+) Transcript_59658:792-2006(+)
MDHDHNAQCAGGAAPRVLPHVLPLARLVLVLDPEHLRKVLAQQMRGGPLDRASVGGDKTLNGGGHIASRKLLLLGLLALHDRDGKELFIDACVEVENRVHLSQRLFACGVGGVPFLPQELASADEGGGVLEFPANHIAPLVEFEGEVSVRPDPVGEVGVHDRLRSGADGDGFLQVGLARLCDPGNFCGEALDVLLLLLQRRLGDEAGKVAGVHIQVFLDTGGEPVLDLLPDLERPRTEDVAAGDVVVVGDHLGLSHELREPSRKVGLLFVGHAELGHFALCLASGSGSGGGTLGRFGSLAPFGLLLGCWRFRGSSGWGCSVKVENNWVFGFNALQESNQVRGGDRGSGGVGEGVEVDEGHIHELLVDDELDGVCFVVEKRERGDIAAFDTQRLHHGLGLHHAEL